MNEYIQSFWSLIFAQQDPIGRAVNLVIVALFAVGVFDVVRALARLALERKLIKQARASLGGSPSQCPVGPEEEVLKFLGIKQKESLLGRRVARVVRLRGAGLGYRDVIQQLSAERVEGYGALARYSGMTLTLLGLLGTVFGLSQALFKIQDAVRGVKDVEGFNQLTEALSGTLGGMKTAFGCTLAGLLTALLISACNYVVRRTQSRVLTELEEFIFCELVPVLEAVDPDVDSAAKHFVKTLTSTAAKLNRVQAGVVSAAATYERSSEVLGRCVEALHGSVNSFGQSVSGITGNQETFTQTMRETRDAVGLMTSAITKQFEENRAFTAASTQALNNQLSAATEVARDNRALQESLQTLAESFQPAILEYHDRFKEVLGGMFDEFKTNLNALLADVGQYYKEGVAGQVQNSHQVFEQALARHLKDVQSLVEQNHKANSDLMAQNEKTVSELIKQSHNEFAALYAQNGKNMEGLFAEQKEALRAFSDMVVDVNFRMGSLFEKVIAGGNGRVSEQLKL